MKLQEDRTVGCMKMEEPALTPAVPMACDHSLQSDHHQHKSSYSQVPFNESKLKGCRLQADGNPTDQQSLLTTSVSEQGCQSDDSKKDENTHGSSKVRYILNCNDLEYSLGSQGVSRTSIRETTITIMKKQARVDDQEPLEEQNCGRERLKRHRVEVAGHVWIPEIWGQEELLKNWIDCTAFDSYLAPQGIMSARAALVEEGRRANSGELRVHNRC